MVFRLPRMEIMETKPMQRALVRRCLFLAITANLALFTADHASGSVINVDLSSILEGTVVSANEPYGGALIITGGQSANIYPETDYQEATIQKSASSRSVPQGCIQAEYSGPLCISLGTFATGVHVQFLEPVTDLSFGLACWRYGGFKWTAINEQGQTLSDYSGPGDPGFPPDTGVVSKFQFLPFDVSLPTGYHFTSFDWANGDACSINGALWIDDISFTVVPDSPDRLIDFFLLVPFALPWVGFLTSRKTTA